ncbi:MAG: protein kinase, partial [Leptolyngbyaceae cyanobacterium SM1_3_5]|nr:protein kinase [Leptolyngbyaceae cyanobacterium SM1_3_5]
MSFCLNRTCPRPQNPDDARFCQTCGWRLRLGDRYLACHRLTSESGSTLLGTDRQTGEQVILKQYAVGERLASFRQDVARLNQLGEHPQIPNLLAYFERESQQYVVQEFVEGQSLLTELQETGTFSETQLRGVLQEILPLLQFLHDRQVIHRDIKPANLLRRDDTLMLVDFGTAKHATKSALAKTGTVLGSAEYAAPEQLVGKAIPASRSLQSGRVLHSAFDRTRAVRFVQQRDRNLDLAQRRNQHQQQPSRHDRSTATKFGQPALPVCQRSHAGFRHLGVWCNDRSVAARPAAAA